MSVYTMSFNKSGLNTYGRDNLYGNVDDANAIFANVTSSNGPVLFYQGSMNKGGMRRRKKVTRVFRKKGLKCKTRRRYNRRYSR